jgi:ankyrin repeat protein
MEDDIELDETSNLAEVQAYLRSGGDPDVLIPYELGDEQEVEVTMLTIAVDLSKMDIIKALLDGGARPDIEDDAFGSPFKLAIQRGNTDVVRRMIGIMGSVRTIQLLNDTSAEYTTPLIDVVLAGDVDMVNLLLEEGADPNVETPEGTNAIESALTQLSNQPGPKSEAIFSRLLPLASPERKISMANESVSRGLLPLVRKLLDSGLDINAADDEGRTLLISAVDSNNLELVQELLGRGANVNQQDEDGETALYFASQGENVEIIQALLKAGANPKIPTNDGYTPLHQAAKEGNLEIVRALLEAGADPNTKTTEQGQAPLLIAVWENHSEVVEELLNRGANPNEKEADGDTALYIAAQENRLPIVKMLLQKGADVNKPAMRDATPLMVASQYADRELVEELLKAGANAKQTDEEGIAALHLAAEENRPEIIQLLTRAGGDVNQTDNTGLAPIDYTPNNPGATPVIEELVRLGANLNTRNPPIITAAGMGILNNNLQTYLRLGANVNAQDPEGNTALMTAVERGNLDGVRTLLEANADRTIRNAAGHTVMDIPMIEIVRSLLEGGPTWRGMNQDDVNYYTSVFTNIDDYERGIGRRQIPAGQAGWENFSMCPVCLTVVDRSDACRYMSHDCSKIRDVFLYQELYDMYKNDRGMIYWCTICGRICFGHRHFAANQVRDRIAPTLLMPVGDPYGGEDKCIGDGGGGLPEKIARMNALIARAAELLPDAARLPAAYCRKELVETAWNAALRIPNNIRDIIHAQRWTTPIDVFPPAPAEVAVAAAPRPPAAPIPKPAADAALVTERIDPVQGRPPPMDMITRVEIDAPDYALRFNHREDNGNVRRHADDSLISHDSLQYYIQLRVGNEGDARFGYCFDNSCQARLWPEDIEAHTDDADVLADYRQKFYDRFTPRGGGRERKPGVFVIVDNERAQCALPEKGGHSKTYRKKNKSKRKTYRKH